jgi:ABC-type thiamin/hydroxymethylpyrimidine transport system permease subunit
VREIDRILIGAVALMAIGFAFAVWLYRRPPYSRWEKIASLVGSAAGITWSIITLFQRPFSIQRYPFVMTVSVKQFLGGIFIGIVISVWIARRCENHARRAVGSSKPEA